MTYDLDPAVAATVRERVRTCLGHGFDWCRGTIVAGLNRGEGEDIRPLERLAVVDAFELDGDRTRYTFELEFVEEIVASGPPSAEPLTRPVDVEGYVDLDEELDFGCDDRGRVRFSPFAVVPPRFWCDDGSGDPPLPGACVRNIDAELVVDRNPVRWRSGSGGATADEVASLLVGWEVDVAKRRPNRPNVRPSGRSIRPWRRCRATSNVGNELELPAGPDREYMAVLHQTNEEST